MMSISELHRFEPIIFGTMDHFLLPWRMESTKLIGCLARAPYFIGLRLGRLSVKKSGENSGAEAERCRAASRCAWMSRKDHSERRELL